VTEAGFLVSGRVQGVGFRWWTRTLGTRLGLSGTVRNRADGTVEVQARGGESSSEELRRRLTAGPPLARVDAVEAIAFSADGIREGEFVTAG
jgi:acylphosphatase